MFWLNVAGNILKTCKLRLITDDFFSDNGHVCGDTCTLRELIDIII